MQQILMVAMLASFAGAQVPAPPPPSFDGRWRLVEPASASPTMPDDLLVTEIATESLISIQRRFASGTRFARFTIVNPQTTGSGPGKGTPSPGGAFWNVATWNGSTLVMKSGKVIQSTAASPAVEHEEAWAIGADGRLYIDAIDRASGSATKTSRVSYTRVPVPPSVPPGVNLLENAAADHGAAFWSLSGNAKVEPCGVSACFVIRSGGSFGQTVVLPKDVVGKYVALIGSGASERINPDRGITGLPSLYALVSTSDGVRIVAHLQGMLGRPTDPDQWVTMSGVFRMPEGAATLSVQLNQASAKDVPNNGSAARFDQVGVYVFDSESEARSFVAQWRGRDR